MQETLEGWGVASEGGLTVALELEITPELRREGLARELVRVVQDSRKAAGLRVSDRIALGVAAEGAVAAAFAEHRDWIASETLATEVRDGVLGDAAYVQEGTIEDSPVTVSLRPA